MNQKSVRDRLKLLIERFKRKTRDEERQTGINPEETELEIALQDIVDLTRFKILMCSRLEVYHPNF